MFVLMKDIFFKHFLAPVLIALITIMLPLVTLGVWSLGFVTNPKKFVKGRINTATRYHSEGHRIDWYTTLTDVDWWMFYLD
jgi:hypothetical protein